MSPKYQVPPESPFALMTADQTQTWFAWMKLQLRLRYEMNRQLRADSNISLADYDVLVALTSETGGVMSVSALAVRIGWERSRTSHHTRRMMERNLVSMRPTEHDRRVREVVLTDDGWETLRNATTRHVELVKRMFFDGLDPAELPVLADMLERVYDEVIEHGTLPRPEDHP